MAPLSLAPALIFLVFFASPPPFGSKAKDTPPDGKKIIDEWAKREPAIQSVRFRWVKVTTGDLPLKPRRDKKPLPPPATPLESKEVLIIKGDRMRFQTAGPAYNERSNAYVNQEYVSNFDGATSKVFYDLSGSAPWRVGFITKRAENQDCDNYHLRPMMLFCLRLSPRYSPFKGAAKCKLGDTEREIQGRRCRAIIKGDESYWFDPPKNNAVILYEGTAGGGVVLRQEIFYKDDPKYGPIPSRWVTKVFGRNDVVKESSSVTVMSYEINKQLSDNLFDMTFPAGTDVREEKEPYPNVLIADSRRSSMLIRWPVSSLLVGSDSDAVIFYSPRRVFAPW
jgi:hypothetical protein